MENKQIHQFSLLGLILIAVSAFITSTRPSKPIRDQINSMNNGTLRQYSGGNDIILNIVSCVVIFGAPPKCHITTLTGTSILNRTSVVHTYFGGTYTTRRNTSQSNSADAIDTTSILTLV